MPTPAKSTRERAESFLRDAVEFRLGPLVTEASHPRSTELSRIARQDAAAGLAVLFDVDRDVVEAYERWSRSGQPEALCLDLVAALEAGGRVFFTGCGATGRLSIQLASIWRAFWQDRRERGLATPPPDAWEGRAESIMAGGDYALIKSVEGFEDFAPFGRKQIADLGVSKGDMVFAITEGGETSFVIGTAWQGLDAGARVVFVYNNPDDVLRAHVKRSREVIDEPRIRKVNLTTGPMAITGSTRMQATSIELLAMLTVLEMALREVLARGGAAEAGLGRSGDVPEAMRDGLRALHAELQGERLRGELARLVVAEEDVYRKGSRTSYFADSLAVDVLTDTTERSPTFCTPAFRKWDDEEASESWAFLFTPAPATEDAWTRLLRRAPQTVEWTEADLRALLDEEAAERQGAILGEISRRELMRFRIGLDGLAYRPARAGDGVTAVAAERDLALLQAGGAFAAELARAREAGAKVAVIAVGRKAALAQLTATAAAKGDVLAVALEAPATPFLLDPLTRIGVKLLLNALSTCTMVRLGRVLGNRMIWVVPSNLKLVDRSTRYIRDLASVSYEDACRALFEVIEYVEPRRRAGRAYPAPVGVATMRLRHGLSLPEAEARLLRELTPGSLTRPSDVPSE
jgi:N-acetylmuramic acid 6-phosphate etherase